MNFKNLNIFKIFLEQIVELVDSHLLFSIFPRPIFTYLITWSLTANLIASIKSRREYDRKETREGSHLTSNNLKSAKIIKYPSDWNPLIFFHFSERKNLRVKIVFSLNASARCSCKNCRETPASGLILLRGTPAGSSLPLLSPSQSRWKRSSCGGNVYPTYSRYLERCHLLYIRELQRQVSNNGTSPVHRRDLHPDYITQSRTSPNIVFYAPMSSRSSNF